MKAGESFGQMALFQENTRRQASAIVTSDQAEFLTISRDDLLVLLHDNIETIIYANLLRWALFNHPDIGHLRKLDLERVMQIEGYQTI